MVAQSAVSYIVDEFTGYSATLNSYISNGCLFPGDEIMLINMQGTTENHANVGHYEFLRVHWVHGKTVYFSSAKTKWYGEQIGADNNIGSESDEQRVVLMRVPNYSNVILDGTITGENWQHHDQLFGIIALRIAGSLSGSGIVDLSEKGYVGSLGNPGESYTGFLESGTAANGGGGGNGGAGGAFGQTGEHGGGYFENNNNQGHGGDPYGDLELEKIFLGSGAGSGKGSDFNGKGGNGGGAIFIAANTITFSGNINANGEDGVDHTSEGGGGSGGGIRIEAGTINPASPLTISAQGGTAPKNASDETKIGGDGGEGRIAIYYDSSIVNVTSSPAYYSLDRYATPTPTPSPTPVGTNEKWGTGNDGDVIIAGGDTVNLGMENVAPQRTCSDGGDSVSYPVIGLNASSALLDIAPSIGCLEPGDEIMLINIRGYSNESEQNFRYENVGNFEFLRVGSVDENVVLFNGSKEKFYGDNAEDDTNIGTGDEQQRVMIVRVPNYQTLEIQSGGILTTNAWDDETGGVLALRIKGSLTVNGEIEVTALGYRGGKKDSQKTGESYVGPWIGSFSNNGGGGGKGDYGSGGGGYRSPGGDGGGNSKGGTTYGQPDLDKIYFGSGGGGTSQAHGGHGGGIIWITANTLSVNGSLKANGEDTPQASIESGGGAGGSIYLYGDIITLDEDTLSAQGGIAHYIAVDRNVGGDGGEGRSAVFYLDEVNSEINDMPDYLNGSATTDLIFSDSFENGDLSAWDTSESDGGDLIASANADFTGNFGLLNMLDDDNSIYVQDDSPNAEERYFAQFYVNPSNVTIGNGEILDLITGRDTSNSLFNIQIQQDDGEFQFRGGIADDSSYWDYSDWSAPADRSSLMSGILAYWSMDQGDGVREDLVGDRTLDYNVIVNSKPGKIDHAANFDTTTDKYLYTSERFEYSATDDRAVSAWIYPDYLGQNNTGAGIITSYRSADGEAGDFALTLTADGAIRFYMEDSTSFYFKTSNGLVSTEDWYHIVLNYDGDTKTAECFINGESQTLTKVNSDFSRTAGLFIGSVTVATGSRFRGMIDELSVWDRVLAANEVELLYNLDNGSTYPFHNETLTGNTWYAVGAAWEAAGGVDATDGSLEFYLNGELQQEITDVDNDTHVIDSVRLGAMGVDAGTSGELYFDDFESRRFTLPETLEDPGAPDPEPTAQPGWLDSTYSYDGDQAHAVTEVVRDQTGGGSTTDNYQYDQNGNMTCRYEGGVLYLHSYNAENRLEKIEEYNGSDCASPGTLLQSWEFSYDGDGNRVKEVHIIGGQTQYTRHLLGGGMYEFEDDGVDVTSRKYYNLGGEMVAMREWVNQGEATIYYFANDHLSSTSIVMDASGSLLSENRYMPFGEKRTISGTTSITETDFTYTGQRDYSGDFGLMDYRYRFLSTRLGRFTQPDSIVPEAGNPQAWNKYSYTSNNPMIYNDPSGHDPYSCFSDGACAVRAMGGSQNIDAKWAQWYIEKEVEKFNIEIPSEVTIIYGTDEDAPDVSVGRVFGEYFEESKTIEIYEAGFSYTFETDYGDNVTDKDILFAGGIVHEAVHAEYDIFRLNNPDSELANLHLNNSGASHLLEELSAQSATVEFYDEYIDKSTLPNNENHPYNWASKIAGDWQNGWDYRIDHNGEKLRRNWRSYLYDSN